MKLEVKKCSVCRNVKYKIIKAIIFVCVQQVCNAF